MAVADLLIAIEANTSQAASQINALKGDIDGVANPANPPTVGEQLAASLEKARPAGLALVALGTAITGAFALSVSTAADFEEQMSGVKAVMTPDDVETFGAALRELALIMGAETAFTASAAAGAIEELIKAGVPAPAVLDGVGRAALDLAAATGIQVVDAATIAANAMNAFRVSVADLPAVMDWLAGTANASAADIGDLRLALSMASAVAAGFGVSMQDTATAIGIFADNGLRGSDAGTSLKTMLLRLIPSTDASYEAMQALGLITADGANAFFNAEGSMRSLSEVAGILQTATTGLTDEQKLMALQTIFGTDAIRAALIMAREGAEGFDDLAASISTMTVAEMAAIRLDNMKGSLEQLGGSVETVAIVIGSMLLPPLRSLVDFATQALNAFLNLDPGIQLAIAAITGLVGVVSLAVGGFVLLYPMLQTLPAAFAALGTAAGVLGGALSPLVVPVLAVAAALGTLYLAWVNDWGGIQDIVTGAWIEIKYVLAVMADNLGGVLYTASQNLANLWYGTLVPALQAINDWLYYNVLSIEHTAQWLGGQLYEASQALASLWNGTLLPALQAVAGWLSANLSAALETAQSALNGGIMIASTALADLWQNRLQPAIQDLTQWLSGTLTDATATLAGLWQNTLLPAAQSLAGWLQDNLLTASRNLADLWQNTLLPAVQGVIGWFADNAEPAIRTVAQWLGDNLLTASRNLADLWSGTLLPAVQGMADWLGTNVPNAAREAVTWFQTNIPNALNTASGFWTNTLLPAIQGAINYIRDTALPNLNDLANALAGRLQDALGGNADTWNGSFLNSLLNVVTLIGTSVLPLINSLTERLAGGLGWAVSYAADLWENYLQPALAFVVSWGQSTLMPYLGSLINLMDAVFGVTMRAAIGLWQNVLWPALQAVGGVLSTLLNPAMEVLKFLLLPIAAAFGAINEVMKFLTPHFNNLADALRKIELPWFLTPGSPTPFELALQGILDVVRLLVSAGNPLAWLETLGDWLGGAWSAIWGEGGEGGMTAGGGSITVYGPLVQIAGNADADEVVGALVAAFDILWTGADNTEGYQPGGNWS